MGSTVTDRITGISTSVAIKAPVKAITQDNVSLSGLGVQAGGSWTESLTAGDRVLVKDQTDATENGVYTAFASGWRRATDFNGYRDVVKGTSVPLDSTGDRYRVITDNPIIVGTSEINFQLHPQDARVIPVASRAAMKAYDVPPDTQFSVEEGGRSGLFVVKTGTPPSDPEEGIYVVLDNGNYAERIDYLYLTAEMFGSDTDAVLAIQAALGKGEKVVLTTGDYSLDSRLTDELGASISGSCKDSVILLTADDIVLLINKSGETIEYPKIENLTIDAGTNGQLDAGLIQVNAVKDALVSHCHLYDGGDPTDAGVRPQGVNGVAFATDNYPTSGKTSANVLFNIFERFTKGAINWTTYAEEGLVLGNKVRDAVGNGFCPAIQSNGGRRLVHSSNLYAGTEGAGFIIGTVGGGLNYKSKNISSFGNHYYDVGSLGLSNNEKNAVRINDGTTVASVENIHVFGELAYSTESYAFAAIYSEKIKLNNLFSDQSNGAFLIQNTSSLTADSCDFYEFNKDNNSAQKAAFFRASSDCTLRDITVQSSAVNLSYAIGGDSVSTGISASFVLQDNVELILNTDLPYFEQSEISGIKKFTFPASSTTNIQLGTVKEGAVVELYVEVEGKSSDGSIYAKQVGSAIAKTIAGTTTLEDSTLSRDVKTGVTTGLSFDVTSDNVRARFLSDAASDVDASVKITLRTF